MTGRIAILSLACRFAEATGPDELWQNVLDGRRSFRRIPPARLPLSEYSEDNAGPVDSCPDIPAGLVSDWTFRRDALRIPRASFDTADLTHWLALETAVEAVASIGGASVLPRERTAVILGNTLTGEFSRSAQLRLRLPYIRRRLDRVLADHGLGPDEVARISAAVAASVAADFPEPNEESLAGALSNTIAGRIANHLDLAGGAWTVDGACASSLLAVDDGCNRIAAGLLDVAVVGGVDLSLDPFELIGFARIGALARDEMRVFDKRAAGFWPGEGCGIAVLASEAAASRLGGTPIAWIAGWGSSTDGQGGLTRPTVIGQARAIGRAWMRAGVSPSEAGYFEAHGTGTAIGDPTEISALAQAIGRDGARLPVGSIKANIGHCKAAAGIAGLTKAALAVSRGAVPPHVSCETPHGIFAETGHRLAPAGLSDFPGGHRRAGVSAFGFGGINVHVVVESDTPSRRFASPPKVRAQSHELFVFAADTADSLRGQLGGLAERAETLALSEMADAAAASLAAAEPDGPYRAAFAVSTPWALAQALRTTIESLETELRPVRAPPRIGYVFPGQSAPVRGRDSGWTRRFPELLAFLPEDTSDGRISTEAAQTAIVGHSLMGLDLLRRAGVQAEAASGHSVGEYAALHWGGMLDEATTRRIVRDRGAVMAEHGSPGGAMLRVVGKRAAVEGLKPLPSLEFACFNGPEEFVLAGPAEQAKAWCEGARAAGLHTEFLNVSHAFHSASMAGAAAHLEVALSQIEFAPPALRIISTVTGKPLTETDAVHALLVRQLTEPVLFAEAVGTLARECDLLIEVGPGAGLARLARFTGCQVASIDAGAADLSGLLGALAVMWRSGVRLSLDWLFVDRPIRRLATSPKLLSNPCGLRGSDDAVAAPIPLRRDATVSKAFPGVLASAFEAARRATADVLGLPVDLVTAGSRLLEDLNLNSISVARIVHDAAQMMGIPPPVVATDLVAGTVDGLAQFLHELATLGGAATPVESAIEGVAPWVAEYESDWEEIPWPRREKGMVWQSFDGSDGRGSEPASAAQGGMVVMLPPPDRLAQSAESALLLWQRVRAVREARLPHLAIVHNGMELAGFARSLLEEGAFASICLIDVGDQEALGRARILLDGPQRGYAEYRVTPRGKLERAVLRHRPLATKRVQSCLGKDDVLLVTGGARGIGAESALRLGRESGAALVLLGRSPANAPEVAETLHRARQQGNRVRYLQVDVAAPEAVRRALGSLAGEIGSPTVLLHAAGINEPGRFDRLQDADLEKVLSAKVAGLQSLLDSVDPARLKLVIGFGSIIATVGLAGEAHYALANGTMSSALQRWGKQHPAARVLALDWSIWAGAGMGERIGAVERLAGIGVEAIPLSAALDRLSLLASRATGTRRLIVTGRFGPPATVDFAEVPTACHRFLETRRLYFPGVEMVFDAKLGPGTDPWLDDHVVDGIPVVPGVMLLEACAQAASALVGREVSRFRNVAFLRAVSPGPEGLILRTAVLRRDDGSVAAVIRASDDGFRADRATAILEFGPPPKIAPDFTVRPREDIPGALLYDGLCFNAGRFRRIAGLGCASAYRVQAVLSPPDPRAWFGPYENPAQMLGDPAARDAGLHVLQVCVPQARVVPVAVEEIVLADTQGRRHSVEAIERESDGREFVFDILWLGEDGAPLEYWKRARFRSVAGRRISDLPYPLLAAAIERAASLYAQRHDVRAAISNSRDQGGRREAVLAALGAQSATSRGDGMPILDSAGLSLSHGGDLTLGVRANGTVACDLVNLENEAEPSLNAADLALLDGVDSCNRGAAAAAIWAARECARKGGLPAAHPLVPVASPSTDIRLFRCGPMLILCQECLSGGCAALLVEPGGIRRGEFHS